MGRVKAKDRHLPARMRRKGKFYYYAHADKWTALGDDYTQALLKWRDMEGLSEGAATMAQLLDNALAAMASDLKPSSFKEAARACNKLKAVFSAFTPDDVKPSHIAQYLEGRVDKNGKPVRVTANREISVLSACWDLARRKGWISLPNPCAGIKRNSEKKRKRIASLAEIKALVGQDCRESDMVLLTLLTGMRESDMLHLSRINIEAEGLRVKPRKTDASTEFEQVFPWTPQLRACIDRALSHRRRIGSLYLFPVLNGAHAGQVYTGPSFWKVWRAHFAACGVSGLTWHDIRRTALNIRKRERGVEAAQEMAAHSSITTTEGYLETLGAVIVLPNSIEI